tara:strand:+ start:859 stop:1689 length:831 start_codon:yes stop_codon:yes gene_type:complete
MSNNLIANDFPIRSDVNSLAKCVIEVMEICGNHKVNTWLCYGALLGMIRNKELLHWNNDAELGCWHDNRNKQRFRDITDHLINKGYVAYYYSSIGSISARKKGVQISINCFWRDGEYAIRPHESPSEIGKSTFFTSLFCWLALLLSSYTGNPNINFFKDNPIKHILKISIVKLLRILPISIRRSLMINSYIISQSLGGEFQTTSIDAKYFNKFKRIDFYGASILIPFNSEELLAYIYGPEWTKPKDSWSYYADENKHETNIKFIDKMWKYEEMSII